MRSAAFGLAAALAAGAGAAQGQEAPIAAGASDLSGVYVWGRRLEGVGQALSASEGTLSFAAFADRPLLRPGELAEVVPGLAATQHSGTGKANQYFMRGFNLDHGTDFSVSLDGAPLNLRSHAHGQGYLDLNGVIPQVVETIAYRKGPYFAELGDFSLAGAAGFQTFETSPEPFVEATAGEYNYRRALGLAAFGDRGWLALDLTAGDGPWDNPERLRKLNAIGRARLGGGWSLTGLAYAGRWNAADQIPQRAVEAGLLSRFGVIDRTDGGRTTRYLLSLQHRDPAGWNAAAYVQRYTLSLFSNFTYFLEDPDRGDQFEQSERRWIYGGSVSRAWPEAVAGWTLRTGADGRIDDIGRVGLYSAQARQRLSTVREDSLTEWSAAGWADALRAFGPVRLQLGLRLDGIGARVRAEDPRNSGSASDVMVSPKAALAWRLSPALEAYANAGRGFHSNDARGATATVVPGGDDPLDPVALLAPGAGGELGLRWSRGPFTATAALWTLKLDSELVYVGDGGVTESSGATRRTGWEVLADWRPVDRLELHLSAAATRARYLGAPAGENRIPNAIRYVVTGGVSARITDRLATTFTLRRLGPGPLVEDNSARSRASTLVNGLVAYDFGRVRLRLEALNLFDTRADDIRYRYTSRLPGEPEEGVDDYVFHPMEPRTLRLAVRVGF